MTQSLAKSKVLSKLPPPLAPFGFVIKALTDDPESLRVLIACTLALCVTTLEPPFLTLGTYEIQSQLRTPGSGAPMLVAAGFLTLALLTLVAGTLGDLFGRRRVLLVGLMGLTLANAWGAVTLGTPNFIVADMLGSITSVFVVPMTVALVTVAFKPTIRPFAYGMLFGFMGTALVLSPIIGALFETLGVPGLAFLPVIVLGVTAIWLVRKNVPESRSFGAIRRTGALLNTLLLAGIFVFVYFLIGGRKYFGNWLPMLVAGGILLLLGLFFRWLTRRSRYLRGVDVYTGRDIALAILAGIMLSAGQGMFFYQMATYLQQIQRLGPVLAGLYFVPFLLGMVVASFFIARLALRFGARRIIAGGLGLMGFGLLGLSIVQVNTPFWILIVPMTLLGIGFGFAVPARTQVVLSAPPNELLGSAAAVNAAAGQSGYAIGVVLSSVMITQSANASILNTLERAGVSPVVLEQVRLALLDVFQRTSQAPYPNIPDIVRNLAGASYANAFVSGLGQTFLLFGLMMFATAGVVFFLMRRGLKASQARPLQDLHKESELPL